MSKSEFYHMLRACLGMTPMDALRSLYGPRMIPWNEELHLSLRRQRKT
jgi:hypothetical protein